ncbi:hypothetical protein DF185_16285 [Marinifilum breve]|uniref:Uncharacterized protein n=1 Tax=Marinifilum breve TaxID=2184082 RepID=A0A2V3ZV21_9BACT|nr:hypothetical protein [Marinifilum breve]PXX98930.1 hypothetical protein DF185_16285 [Marinifilum breve]
MRNSMLFIVATLLTFSCNPHPAKTDIFGKNATGNSINKEIQFNWLLDFNEKSTNTLVHDKRFEELKEIVIPDRNLRLLGFDSTLKRTFTSVMGGPPNQVKIDTTQNYLVASACRRGSCSEKGFIWFDLLSNKGVIAIVNHFPTKDYSDQPHLYITSKNYQSQTELREMVISEIKAWLKTERLTIPQDYWTFDF